jgi:hypothetical protein
MTDETRKSLEYLERTARRLLNGEHPQPQRAAYLLQVHADQVAHEFPEGGWP